MALISFFSAKGAPGVTSTAMLVAALWPRPTLLVDADGNGGDVGLRLTSPNGTALTRNPGLLSLLPLARHGLAANVVLDHSQVALGGQRVLVGVENPEQADAGVALWPILARAFHALPGMDVVIDAGQLTSRAGQLSLVQHSDLAIGVVRAEASSVVHMRRRAASLAETFNTLGADAPTLGMVCVETVQGQPEASSAVGTIAAEIGSLHDFGQVALDSRAVRMFHGEPVSRPERTMLVRSGRSLVERLVTAAGPTLAAPLEQPLEQSLEDPTEQTVEVDPAVADDEQDETAPDARPRRRRLFR